MKKVFIIGNGPSATAVKRGALIDAADVVVRINDFKTEGYEEFVGSKTDILFTCRLNEYMLTLHQFPEVIISLLMNPLDGVVIPDELLLHPNISTQIHWPQVKIITALLSIKKNCYPSTGLLCILFMAIRYGQVSITGFDFFADGNRHYYSNGDRPVPTRHDGKREKEIIQLLVKKGAVIIQ
jgi:hypothetical protein